MNSKMHHFSSALRVLALPAVTTLISICPLSAQDGDASPKKLRVVTFGDSTTAQRGSVKVYTAVLQERLPGVEFVNKGVGGNTTAMAAKRFQSDVIAAKPDVTVIQFGINDAAVDLWKTPPATESRVLLDDYETNLRAFVTDLRAIGSDVILMTPNQTRWSAPMIEKYGKSPYDPADPQGFTFILARYAERMRKVARDMNVPLVDIYALYDTPERKTALCLDLLPDGMHPSMAGHAMVAENLEPLLRKMLGQSGASEPAVGAALNAP